MTESDSHIAQLERGAQALAAIFPLEPASLHSLAEEQTARLDQFIYRFTKLQDSIGRRLLPALYAYAEGDDEPKPFLDILSRFEQLGAVTSADQWQYFRNLRNNLAHDYPESVDQTVATLNELFEHWRELVELYTAAKEFYRAHSG